MKESTLLVLQSYFELTNTDVHVSYDLLPLAVFGFHVMIRKTQQACVQIEANVN